MTCQVGPYACSCKNQSPAHISHLHNLFQRLSLGGPGAHCLMKQCSLILGRAISGLTAVQEESLFSGKGFFGMREGLLLVCICLCVHVSKCVFIPLFLPNSFESLSIAMNSHSVFVSLSISPRFSLGEIA